MIDPQDEADLVDEYINEQLDQVHPISNYIHKILHTKLHEMIRDFPDWIKGRQKHDPPTDTD
jgi:hypothetical protein